MATIELLGNMTDFARLESATSGALGLLGRGPYNPNQLRYNKFDVFGTFTLSADRMSVLGGTVSSIQFLDATQALSGRVTGISIGLNSLLSQARAGTLWTNLLAGADIVSSAERSASTLLMGYGGNDEVFASEHFGEGRDTLDGGAGSDTLNGGGGADTIYGGGETDPTVIDYLYGGGGDFGDLLFLGPRPGDPGVAGRGALFGHDGHDELYGGPQSDLLVGGLGADLLVGEGGGDFLIGFDPRANYNVDGIDGPRDVMIGGPGADRIVAGQNALVSGMDFSGGSSVGPDAFTTDDRVFVRAPSNGLVSDLIAFQSGGVWTVMQVLATVSASNKYRIDISSLSRTTFDSIPDGFGPVYGGTEILSNLGALTFDDAAWNLGDAWARVAGTFYDTRVVRIGLTPLDGSSAPSLSPAAQGAVAAKLAVWRRAQADVEAALKEIFTGAILEVAKKAGLTALGDGIASLISTPERTFKRVEVFTDQQIDQTIGAIDGLDLTMDLSEIIRDNVIASPTPMNDSEVVASLLETIVGYLSPGAGAAVVIGGPLLDALMITSLDLIEVHYDATLRQMIENAKATQPVTVDLSGDPNGGLRVLGAGADKYRGSAGRDTAYGGAGADTLEGGDGDDEVDVGGSASGHDLGFGGRGNDLIRKSAAGQLYAEGGEGNDTVISADAADALADAPDLTAWDYLFGDDVDGSSAGNDVIAKTSPGRSYQSGGGGADTLTGGNQTLPGAEIGDYLFGDAGADSIIGGGGSDVLVGSNYGATPLDVAGVAFDSLFGGAGNDWVLQGRWGAGRLDGGDGSDTIVGAGGADTIVMGRGSDWAYGGGGGDRFEVAASDLEAGAVDSIIDFYLAGSQLVFSGVTRSAVTFSQTPVTVDGVSYAFGLASVALAGGGVHTIVAGYVSAAQMQAQTTFL